MTITSYKVKQYNSVWKRVICCNGEPVVIASSDKQESDIIAYLNGYKVDIPDGRIKKELDRVIKKYGK